MGRAGVTYFVTFCKSCSIKQVMCCNHPPTHEVTFEKNDFYVRNLDSNLLNFPHNLTVAWRNVPLPNGTDDLWSCGTCALRPSARRNFTNRRY